MNECIRQRDLVLTLICKCGNQYGKWRPHCPVCREPTPRKAQDEYETTTNPRVRRAVTRKVKELVRRESKTQCIFCRHRGAKQRCPHCNEMIHGTCLGLHVAECQQFQVERDAAITRLTQGGTS